MAGEFDKDFGYLMPFLDRVAATAASLADPAARAELTKLMAEEKTRWARIRQLLGGASGQAQATPTATTPGNNAAPLGVASTASTEAREPLSFTVGSLRPKRT
jgi:hypothetical protein